MLEARIFQIRKTVYILYYLSNRYDRIVQFLYDIDYILISFLLSKCIDTQRFRTILKKVLISMKGKT
jgi:hypothetical protein